MNIKNNKIDMMIKSVKDDLKILKLFIIRRNIMKSRIVMYSALIGFFLIAFSGCGLLKKTETKSSSAGKLIYSADSNSSGLQSEEVLFDNSDNQSWGMNAGNRENADSETEFDNQQNTGDIKYETEEILNDNPISIEEDASLDNFENTLSTDGDFVNVTEEEVDPDNNFSSETVKCETDIYTNVIWVPKTTYVYAGWNPYTNGRWVLTRYGWTWKSYYQWGWATYHYGRWWYSSRYGWVWSPGRKWAPAWVIWGHHGNYTGWHPISPRIRIYQSGISPIMPRLGNNGWVVVKTTDFTKKVNNKTIITGTVKNDIIKNTTKTITLKQNGNNLINKGPDIKKNEIITNTEKKNVTGFTASVKQNIKKLNTSTTKSEVKKDDNNTKKNIKMVTTEPKKQNSLESDKTKTTKTETKTIKNETKKQVNETKKTKTENPVKTEKQTNTVSTSKSKNENKTVNKVEPKKTTESKQKKEENSFTKSNNNVNSNKIENVLKTIEKPVVNKKTESSTKIEKTAPKIEQAPKVKSDQVNSKTQKNTTKEGK